MGNEQQVEGKLEQARGTVKETVGDALDNEQMEQEGKYDRTKGQVREGIGDVKEGVENTVEDATDAWNKR